MEEIDTFLDTLPDTIDSTDHVLILHEKYIDILKYSVRRNRYRGFLVVFESVIEESYMFVTHIDSMIDNLRADQHTRNYFTQQKFETLKYLCENRYQEPIYIQNGRDN